MSNEYRYFHDSNFVGGNSLSLLIYLDRDNDVKQFKAQRYYLPKDIIKNYNIIIIIIIIIISGNNFFEQPIDSDVKRYKEIRLLTTGQGEDYTTECLLDYEYLKRHYRLITVDLRRHKELDANPKAILEI